MTSEDTPVCISETDETKTIPLSLVRRILPRLRGTSAASASRFGKILAEEFAAWALDDLDLPPARRRAPDLAGQDGQEWGSQDEGGSDAQ